MNITTPVERQAKGESASETAEGTADFYRYYGLSIIIYVDPPHPS